MNHKVRQNIVIYGSLLIAIILLAMVAKEYYENKNSNEPLLKELDQVFGIKSSGGEVEEKKIIEEEPNSIKNVDKVNVINKYLDNIINRIIEDEILTYEIVSSWGSYKVIGMQYIKSITDNYYAYKVSIMISNKGGIIIGDKRELDNNIVLDLEFDILISNDDVVIKNVAI